jgi:hypothetical protein
MQPRRVILLLLVVVAALAIDACGGAAPRAKPHEASQAVLSHCMRAHGIQNFPDPTVGPGGQLGMSVSQSSVGPRAAITVEGIPFSGPKFTAAENACKMFGGRDKAGTISASKKASYLKQALCMRRHGVPNFPDPTFPAGGAVQNNLGPNIDMNAPAFGHAAKSCLHTGTPLPGGG